MATTATRLGYGQCRELDFRPATVDLRGYAGDTMKLRVQADDASIISGGTWSAQVRATKTDPVVAATFAVEPLDALTVLLTLAATDTAALGGGYVGVWDVQVEVVADTVEVKTLVQGSIKLDADVTRGVG